MEDLDKKIESEKMAEKMAEKKQTALLLMLKGSDGKKYWETKAAVDDEESGEIYIYGDSVVYKWFDNDVTAADFKKDLDALGDIKTLNVYINSCGGSVFQGQAIYSILKRHSAYKNVYVDGIAASAASFIAMAGDTIYMPENAMLMLHNPWSFAIGNANDMQKEADRLNKVREAMLPAYLNKTGKKLTEEKLIELLDAETWLTAKESKEYGFCDKVVKEKKIAASTASAITLALADAYENIPEAAKKMLLCPADSSKEAETKEREAMLQESRANIERIKNIMEEILR